MRTRVHTSVTQSAAATAVEDLWPQRSGCEPDGLVLPAAPAGGARLVSPELRTPARRSHRRGCNASNRQQNILPNHTARSLSGRWHYGRQYNGSAEHVAMYHGEPRPVVDFAALATKSEPPSRPVPSQIHSTALVQVQRPSGRRPPSGRRRRGIISHPRRPLLRHLPLTAAGPPLGLPSSTFLSIWHISPPFPFHWIGR